MRVGSMNNPRNSVLDELRVFAGFGLDFIDLTVEAPEASPDRIRGVESDFRRLLGEYGMSVVCHMPWFLQITSPYRRVRDAFIREAVEVIGIASSFNAEHVTIHPDFLTLNRHKNDLRELTIESLGVLVDRAGEAGLVLCFENFERAHVSTDSMNELFRQLPELKFTLDVGHAFMGSRDIEHIRHLVNAFSDRLVHVHMHDNLGHQDDHLPLGVGRIDLPGVVSVLKGAGFDGTVTLEIHSQDRDYIRISRDKLVAMWGN